jgi:hypothetical protein
MKARFAQIGSLLSILSMPVHAARISSVTASTNMGSGFGTNIQNTVNGVGLASLSLTAFHAASFPTNSWFSAFGTPTGMVTFSLGGTFDVSSFSFWNQNGGGTGTAGTGGIHLVTVQYSTNGVNFFNLVGGPAAFAQVAADGAGPEIFNFGTVSASQLRFLIASNYGNTELTGFAEVGFNGIASIPEPGTLTGVIIGLGILIVLRRVPA